MSDLILIRFNINERSVCLHLFSIQIKEVTPWITMSLPWFELMTRGTPATPPPPENKKLFGKNHNMSISNFFCDISYYWEMRCDLQSQHHTPPPTIKEQQLRIERDAERPKADYTVDAIVGATTGATPAVPKLPTIAQQCKEKASMPPIFPVELYFAVHEHLTLYQLVDC